ncbi:MAG: OprO/OprP family phosphate-selective porin [Acidobacteria bacterium]|nr:OprO/OprP family phosphate-selective porin [Acidobacteriota bacterium]MDW7984743.1 porin [Acidobacteriota bacterium]
MRIRKALGLALLLGVLGPLTVQAVEIKVGGRIQNDWSLVATGRDVEPVVGSLTTGTRFRRARVLVEGTLDKRVEFRAEYEFAGGQAGFTDVYIGLKGIPGLGQLRVGHFKEPFSLEELTSARFITFNERSLPNVFVPARNTGVMVGNAVLKNRLTWAAGVFRDTNTFGDGEGDGEYSLTGRLTGLPWYADKGQRLIHVGVAFSQRKPDGDQVRFRLRPEVSIAPNFVDTRDIRVDGSRLLGAEGAVVFGPFSVQGEYITTTLDRVTGSDVTFAGYYVYASVFLTGEHRPYRTSTGVFDRVKPRKSLADGGPGAFEIAVRYSWLDLDDQDIRGGRLADLTVGLNWYLNGNTAIKINYVRADRRDVGTAQFLVTRFQVDF